MFLLHLYTIQLKLRNPNGYYYYLDIMMMIPFKNDNDIVSLYFIIIKNCSIVRNFVQQMSFFMLVYNSEH